MVLKVAGMAKQNVREKRMVVGLWHELPALPLEAQSGPLEGFTMLDAEDQGELARLSEGMSVELTDPEGGSYGTRAEVDPDATIGSVVRELSGAKLVAPKTENLVPYWLYGDSNAGERSELNGDALPIGNYALCATAYEDSNLGGDVLGTLEVSFTVTDGS